MLFNSYIFLFVFLPIVLLGWYGLNHFGLRRLACAFLTAMSLWFYAYFNSSYLFIILFSMAANYALSGLLALYEKKHPWQSLSAAGSDSSDRSGCSEDKSLTAEQKKSILVHRLFLLAGLALNLGLFFYFKYFDFFVENINALFHADFALRHILLPLGISFFTFQQLSFMIDRAKGKARHYSFLSYATFVTFFPQLIAGPIVLYDEMMPQFEDPANRRFNPESFARGALLFTLGLGKKVLLADVLAVPANYGFSCTYNLDTLSVILVLLSYAFELYFDFSGYCDMAMGLGRMFNIQLPENFLSPYKAATSKELWNRWHVTLTRFFTQYVYFPLGGSRRGAPRTMLNILIVFALSGLWHGANWTYVAWGIMQGLLVVWDTIGLFPAAPAPGEKPAKTLWSKAGHKPLLVIPRPLGTFFTFCLFMVSLVFFRSQSMTYAFEMFRRLLFPTWPGWLTRTAQTLDLPELYLLTKGFEGFAPSLSVWVTFAIWMLLLLCSGFLIFTRRRASQIAADAPLNAKTCLLTALLLVWGIISLSQVSTFLYFNF